MHTVHHGAYIFVFCSLTDFYFTIKGFLFYNPAIFFFHAVLCYKEKKTRFNSSYYLYSIYTFIYMKTIIISLSHMIILTQYSFFGFFFFGRDEKKSSSSVSSNYYKPKKTAGLRNGQTEKKR